MNAFYANGTTQREAFYSSKVGQKVLQVLPLIKKEGEEFGRQEYRRIVGEIERETHVNPTGSDALR